MMSPPPMGPPNVGYTSPKASPAPRAKPKAKPPKSKRSAKDVARVRAVLKAPK